MIIKIKTLVNKALIVAKNEGKLFTLINTNQILYMKYFYLFFILFITSCDSRQGASGIVLDATTHIALDSVALGKGEKEDSSNSFTQREYTNEKGEFEYHSLGMTSDFELYFSKKGYQVNKVEVNEATKTDTIYLTPILAQE